MMHNQTRHQAHTDTRTMHKRFHVRTHAYMRAHISTGV